MLQARGVTRGFAVGRTGQRVQAVSDVDLQLQAGELLVLSGPSGSGKTTLLHLLAGLELADSGHVALEGQRWDALDRGRRADLRLRRLGLVFAEHNLCASLTAAENVELPLQVRGLPRDERRRRVDDALARLGVGELGGRFPDALSSGQQQRVAVARALAGEPALLVADEPTAHLDGESARALVELLAALVAERRLAAVVATHDARLLSRASRVLRLEDGRAREEAVAAPGAGCAP